MGGSCHTGPQYSPGLSALVRLGADGFDPMHYVTVQIVRVVDRDFPGWVECELVDASGRVHVMRDKAPIFVADSVDGAVKYPMRRLLRCEIVERRWDSKGRELVRICTEKPDDVSSTEGLYEFTVTADQVGTS